MIAAPTPAIAILQNFDIDLLNASKGEAVVGMDYRERFGKIDPTRCAGAT
jgi:hypothetical protein